MNERYCKVWDCFNDPSCRGYCSGHYGQVHRGKTPGPIRKKRPTGTQAARDEQGRKHCLICDQWLNVNAFAPSRKASDGLRASCRDCRPFERKHQRFGISPQDFQARLAAQGGGCAICETTTPGTKGWCIDHDHACCANAQSTTCGQCVRGILCGRCNSGLGFFKDSSSSLMRAAAYLETSKIGAVA